MHMLRVGVIGLGDVSSVHIHAIHSSELGKLVAVCDKNETLRKNFLDIPFYTDIDKMLEDMHLDVVHICLPHDLHAQVTEYCVEEDVHVFLEKPVAINYEESLKQLSLENTTPKKMGVCFQNRYNASFLKLMDFLNNQDVGKVISIKGLVTWYRPEQYYTEKPWRGLKSRAGYGTVINQSIHTLDLIQLIGGEVESCKATLSNLTDYDIEVEDTATAVFTFKSGVNAFFHATNAYTHNSSVELQVITEKEKFTIKDNRLYYTNHLGVKEIIVEDEKMSGTKSYYGAGHSTLIHRFYKSIIENKNDYVTVEDSIPSMEMIELMDQSSQSIKRANTVNMEEILNDKRKNWRASHDVKAKI